MTEQEFIKTVYPYAEEAARALNVPTDVIIAHWSYESGNEINPANNLAGIGAFDNTASRQTPWGYSYSSLEDFTNAYINLIKKNYPNAEGAQNVEQYGQALMAKGYATKNAADYVKELKARYFQILPYVPAIPTEPGLGAAPSGNKGEKSVSASSLFNLSKFLGIKVNWKLVGGGALVVLGMLVEVGAQKGHIIEQVVKQK